MGAASTATALIVHTWRPSASRLVYETYVPKTRVSCELSMPECGDPNGEPREEAGRKSLCYLVLALEAEISTYIPYCLFGRVVVC